MLRFSANLSMLFTEVPLSERFQLARQAGFQAVEIQFPYELPPETIQALLAQHQLKLVLFNVAADDLLQGGEGLACVPAKQAQFDDALRQARYYAEILKPHAINVLPGRCLDPQQRESYWQCLLANLQQALEQFSPLGILTVVEAINTFDMPGFLVSSEAELLRILHHLPHPQLKLQYDLYHMTRMQQNPAQFIHEQADKIGHIQFADVPGRHEPSTGKIDFRVLFNAIENSAYDGWLGAEYKPRNTSQESLEWLGYFQGLNPLSPTTMT